MNIFSGEHEKTPARTADRLIRVHLFCHGWHRGGVIHECRFRRGKGFGSERAVSGFEDAAKVPCADMVGQPAALLIRKIVAHFAHLLVGHETSGTGSSEGTCPPQDAPILTTSEYFRARADRNLRLAQLVTDPEVSRDLHAEGEAHRTLAAQLEKHASPSLDPDPKPPATDAPADKDRARS